MQDIILLKPTENEQTNDALRATIGIFETTFPGQVRGYYVEGSYADQSEVTTSDIDLMIVFKGDMTEVNAQAEALARYCCALSSVELDIGMADEKKLAAGATPYFKMGGVLIYGEDIRADLPLVPLIEWTRDRMHSSLWRTVNLFNRSDIVRYPLDYPDPRGEFLLSELRAEDVEGKLYALWVLSQIVYQDKDVEEAVATLAQCELVKVSEAAQKALQKFPR